MGVAALPLRDPARMAGRSEQGALVPGLGPRTQPWALTLQHAAGNRAVRGLLHPVPRVTAAQQRTEGEPLDAVTRGTMESRFGQDFSGVQVRRDPAAAASARRLGARAFTVGEQVHLGPDVPALETTAGRAVLAHELAHVVQQRRGGDRPAVEPDSGPEREAEAAGATVAAGGTPAPIAQGTAVGVARQPTDPRHVRGYAGEQGMGFRFGRGEQMVVVRGEQVEVNGRRIPARARDDGAIIHRGREVVLDGDGVFRFRDTGAVARACNPHYYTSDGRTIPGRSLPGSTGGRSSQFYDPRTRRTESWRPPTVERRRGAPSTGDVGAPEPDRALAARMREVNRLRTEFENRVRVAQERGGLTEEEARTRVRARMTAREREVPGRGEFEAGQTVASSEQPVAEGVRRRSSTAARQKETQVPVTRVPSARLHAHLADLNRRLGTDYRPFPRALQHAEVRQVVQNPSQSAFYPDRPMCGHCQRLFVLESRARVRDLTVFDPDGTARVFTPDGRIVEFRGDTVYERRATLSTGRGRTQVRIGSHPNVVHSARPRSTAAPLDGPRGAGSRRPAEPATSSPAPTTAPREPATGSRLPSVTAGSTSAGPVTRVRGPRPARPVALRRGRGAGGGTARAGLAAVAGAVLDMVMSHYAQKWYADDIRRDAERLVREALERGQPDFERLVADNDAAIRAAQAEGRHVNLRIDVDTNWGGERMTRAEVGSVQLVYEGEPEPAPYSTPQPGGWLGGLVRDLTDVRLDHQTFDVRLAGTDPEARRRRRVTERIDARLQGRGGAGEPFEQLVVESRTGGEVGPDDLRDYARRRADEAQRRGDRGGEQHWRRMASLASASLEVVIARAKVASVPLGALRRHAVRMRNAPEQEGAGVGTDWAAAVRAIDAPLAEEHRHDRQLHRWTQPAPPTEVARQRARIRAMEHRLVELEARLAEAGRHIDRNDNEPPHPDWAEQRRLRPQIIRLREDIEIERRLLRDLETGIDPARVRGLMSGSVGGSE